MKATPGELVDLTPAAGQDHIRASMERRRGPDVPFQRLGPPVSAGVLLALLLTVALAEPRGANVHRPGADCTICHTADRTALEENPAAARTALVPDIDARCTACHSDEGPSHHTGMAPRKPVPATLPLSGSGLIICATCHFVHGEQNPYGDFLRVDNSRGGLCLTCHQLTELE